MNHLLIAATVTLALATILSLYRVFRGPTVFDRLTGLGLIGTKTVVILVLLGFLTRRLDMFVDIGLAYGLIGFIGTLVLAKYFERKEAEQP
jgi:multicomponent Na+:H+ antiporter subunit F